MVTTHVEIQHLCTEMRVVALELLVLPMVDTTTKAVVNLFVTEETPLHTPRMRPYLEDDDTDTVR